MREPRVADAAPATTPAQRWRVRYARDASAAGLSQRDEIEAWQATIAASELPVVCSGPENRPRLTFAVALPVGSSADDEAFELLLHQRLTSRAVTDLLIDHVPTGHRIVQVHDVWVGAPSIVALVRRIDYRMAVSGIARMRLATVVAALLAASELPYERDRGGRTVRHDLRPLIDSLEVDDGGHPDTDDAVSVLRIGGRVDPERGVFRPDELVAEIDRRAGRPVHVESVVRTRVVIADG